MRYDRPGAQLEAWQEGRTGFPVVDAGMRQLRATGWMHNRVRMIAASFLVKDLHLEWQHGARHFMRWLVDGDLASNQHGWQWTAGCGTDAAPYFRVFNPTSQGRKFDPDGRYVRPLGRGARRPRPGPGPARPRPGHPRPGRLPGPDRGPQGGAAGGARPVEARSADQSLTGRTTLVGYRAAPAVPSVDGMRTRWLPVLALAVLAPVCAEYLWGYDDSTGHPGTLVGNLIIFTPLYGCPALLIREVARRRGLGWPGIVLLAAAFGVIEAGLVDQSMFSRDYRDIPYWHDIADPTYVAPIGLSIFLAVTFVSNHVIASIAGPIALVEALAGKRGREPWLGRPMIVVTTLLYLGASALVLGDHLANESDHASAGQLVGAGVAAALLIVGALLMGRRTPTQRAGAAPSPWLVASGRVRRRPGLAAAASVAAGHRRAAAGVRRGGCRDLVAVRSSGVGAGPRRRGRRRRIERVRPGRVPDRPDRPRHRRREARPQRRPARPRRPRRRPRGTPGRESRAAR